MKNPYRFLIAAAALTLVAVAGQARARGSPACCPAGSCCNGGVAASPKVRAMLDERCRNKCATPDQAAARRTVTAQTASAASPKVQSLLNAQPISQAERAEPGYVGYRATGSDGITASPKVRAMLDEREQTVQVAPLK